MRNDGFSYIEFILYIALISLFIGGVVQFYQNMVSLRVKSSVAREITANIQITTKRLIFEIRNASAINTITSTSICLASTDAARNPTHIYVQDNRLRIGWGGGSVDCTNLTQDHPLSSNLVNIGSFNFQNLSNSLTKNIQFSFVVSYAAANTPKEWIRSSVASGSAELRSF